MDLSNIQKEFKRLADLETNLMQLKNQIVSYNNNVPKEIDQYVNKLKGF